MFFLSTRKRYVKVRRNNGNGVLVDRASFFDHESSLDYASFLDQQLQPLFREGVLTQHNKQIFVAVSLARLGQTYPS